MASPLLDFDNKPNQRAFFYDTGRVVAYFGGYGNGKTYAACAKGWMLAETIPGNVGLVGRKTYPALNSTTRETFLTLARARNGGTLEPGPVIEIFNKADNFLRLRNGSVVWFRTLDEVEKLRSLNLGWAVVDQAEEVAYEIYLELNGRIRFWNPARVAEWKREHGEACRSALGFVPTPYNQLVCVGNPAPNWVKKEFKEGGDHNHLYEASTHENQKYLPTDYIDEMKKRYPPEWVARFIEGSWDTFGGQVFKEFQPNGVHAVPWFDVPKSWPVFVGWDHGMTNPTAVMTGAVDEEGNVVLVDEYYRSGLTVDQFAQEAKDHLAKWPVKQSGNNELLVYMDPSTKGQGKGPSEISVWEAYRRHGIFGLGANNDVPGGLLWMQYLIHPDPEHPFPRWHPRAGELGAPRFFVLRPKPGQMGLVNFTNEMALYEWEEKRPEQNEPERPRKWMDHSIDAVRYLLMGVKETRAEKVYNLTEATAREQDSREKAFMRHLFTQDEE